MADPVTGALLLSAAATPAVATPFTMGLMGAAGTAATTAAPSVLGALGAGSVNPLITSLVNGGAAGSLISPVATGTTAANVFPAALSSTSPAFVGPKMFMGPQAPTLGQSIMNTGQNIYGLMGENPGLTNAAMSAGSSMLQPEPPPQVLQAPSIQGGQFAPVDFMSLLSQQPQQMPRRTSLLG